MHRHIPNLLTIARLCAAPIIALMLLLSDDPLIAFAALILFILAALTDWLDGYLARRWQIVSGFGRMLDPIADKLMVLTLLLAFMGTGLASIWFFIPALIIVTREIMVSGLREFMAGRNVTMHVTMAAKLKTTFQLIAMGFLIGHFAFAQGFLHQLATQGGLILLWIAAYLTGQTGIAYFTNAWRQMDD